MSVISIDSTSTDSRTDTWLHRWQENEKDKQLSLLEIFLYAIIRSISDGIFGENQTF